MDKRFILDAGFYCKSANTSTEVLARAGNKIVTKSNNASFDS